jgi:transcriptional regulator with XRE-family HTH domain
MRRGIILPMGQPQFEKTFIRQWRQHRRLTLEQLGDRIGLAASHLSMLERGKRGYTQETLEAIAKTLGTDPASLLMRDPNDPDPIWVIWDRAKPAQRAQLLAVGEALIKTGT